MRQIKFRGMTKEGNWVYGDLITRPVHHDCVILEHGVINHSVRPETVGQFTGLLDRSKTEIYEGDIVKDADKVYRVVFAEYEANEWTFLGWALQNSETTFGFTSEDTPVLEIIGNIYTSPKLIR